MTLRTARSLTSGRVIAVYQPHVVERTRQLHAELGAALGLADIAIVTDIIGARDAPREGVTGKLVVDSLPPHVRAGWAPTPERRRIARPRLGAPGRSRDHLRGGGAVEDRARDRGRVAAVTAAAPPFREDVLLSRLTTIGTGGPARAYAEPATIWPSSSRHWSRRASGVSRSQRSASARTCSPRTRGRPARCCA